MKKCIAYLMALSLAAVPIAAQAEELKYDDDSFENFTALSLTASPAVQFEVDGTGVYALDSISFYLLQETKEDVVVAPDGAPANTFAAETSALFPVTVQIWTLVPGSSEENPEYVKSDSIDADFTVEKEGWYSLDLTDDPTDPKIVFTDSIRIVISPKEAVSTPDSSTSSLKLGIDSTSSMPFGQSYTYDLTVDPPSASPAPALNHGIRANVHFVPTHTCQGFLPPLNRTVTMKQGGRTLPLKAKLFDADGAPLTARRLASPPLVELLYTPSTGPTEDVTDKVAPAGKSNKGQAFRNGGRGMWMYNLKTRKDLLPGSYLVLMVSEDVTKYVIEPGCTATFVIEAPVTKKGKK